MCRSRRELSNAYLLAKIGVDTAENEPLEIWGENSIQYSLHSVAPSRLRRWRAPTIAIRCALPYTVPEDVVWQNDVFLNNGSESVAGTFGFVGAAAAVCVTAPSDRFTWRRLSHLLCNLTSFSRRGSKGKWSSMHEMRALCQN